MTKKGLFVPVVLALAALLITGIPVFAYGEEFLSLPWWPAVVALSAALAALALIAAVCYTPAPRAHRVYWDQKRMDISYGSMFPVVLRRGLPDGTTARVRFAEVEGELLVKDYSSGEIVMTKTDDGLVHLSSGNFIVTKLPKHFRVTWSSETWVEDKEEKS